MRRGEPLQELIGARWPVSHTLAVRSMLPDAIRWLSGENATQRTPLE